MNLGPSNPVKSTGKYVNQSLIVQSPITFAKKATRGFRDMTDSTVVNQNHLVKKLQANLNQRRESNTGLRNHIAVQRSRNSGRQNIH